MTLRLIILGRQGAGKGTQSTLISSSYGIPHISTGDMLRAAVVEGSELGQRAKIIMDAGDLVPDDLMNSIVADRLGSDDAQAGFLLDGFPRTAAQATWLDETLAPGGIDMALNIEVPDQVAIERMLARKRPDDTEDAIRRRLDLYAEQTQPLLSHYAERVATIDGHAAEEIVGSRVAEVIDAYLA